MTFRSYRFWGLDLCLMKHAVEADHVAAVSTIASEHPSIIGSSFVGALWGIGHTISLLIAAALIVLLHVEISTQVSLALEFLVGLMLIVLGANALRKLFAVDIYTCTSTNTVGESMRTHTFMPARINLKREVT